MFTYAHQQNLARYRRLLLLETDPARRAVLQRLLAEEKQAETPADPKPLK